VIGEVRIRTPHFVRRTPDRAVQQVAGPLLWDVVAGEFQHKGLVDTCIVFLAHGKDRRFDLMELEALTKDVDQVELLSDDRPGRANGECGGLGIDDGGIPALHDRLASLRGLLVALKMLQLEQGATWRRRLLEDLGVVGALAEVPKQLVQRSLVEALREERGRASAASDRAPSKTAVLGDSGTP